MTYLSLSLLGTFQAWTVNGIPQTFRTSKERALLSYLVVEHGRAHRREKLAAMFWPERSAGIARNNLRQALYGIRQVIGEAEFDAIFHITVDVVQFRLSDQIWFDMAAYDVHQKAWQTHDHAQSGPCIDCLQHLRDAVEIYRGSFLEDVSLDKYPEFEGWVRFYRDQYLNLQLQSLEFLVSEYEQLGDYIQAAIYARRQVQLEDIKEGLYGRLMILLARTGQNGAAMEQYEICRSKLDRRLGMQPSQEISELAEQIRAGKLNMTQTLLEVQHNLPEQLLPFFGREMELAYITRCLETPNCRLLTIVGPGGVGKTRLAIQAGRLNLYAFPHGVYFVSLESAQTAGRLPEMIASALGLALGGPDETGQVLLDTLRLKQILLILDDFEHIMDSSALLLEILRAAPHVKLLVTSRERLNYQAEFLVELNGLSFPAETAETFDYRQFSALRLFMDRVSRVRPLTAEPQSDDSTDSLLKTITPQDMQSAIRICRLVDGLPLGIELATSWARDFPLSQIADEVQRSLDFLQTTFQDVPERHRSLRASFEHSWELLSETEREIFCKLAVFPGSVSPAAALAVAGAALPWLVRLEDKSLLRRPAQGRYDLHPLIRQFAGLKLHQYSRKIEDQARQQHAEFFVAFVSERESDLKGFRQASALSDIEIEYENIHAAWDWASEHGKAELLVRAAFGLMLFYEIRSRWREGEAAFCHAVKSLENGERHSAVDSRVDNRRALALLLTCQGWFCCRLTRFEKAEALIQKSLALQGGDDINQTAIFTHFALGFLSVWMGRFQDAWLNLTRSQAQAEKLADSWAQAWSRELLVEISFESGQSGFDEEPFLGTLAIFERIGEQRGSSRALNYLGNIAMAQQRLDSAGVYYGAMLSNIETIGDTWGAASGYNKLGQLAAAKGDYEHAWNLHQRGLLLVQKTGDQRRSAYTLSALGEAALALNHASEAENDFRQALEIASATRNPMLAQEVLTGLAAALLHSQKTNQAVALLDTILASPPGDPLTSTRAARLLESARPGKRPGQGVESGAEAQPALQAVWDRVDALLQDGIFL